MNKLMPQTRSKIYFILANISLILLFYSIWQIKPLDSNITDYLGLTSNLTAFYWVGLFIITLYSLALFFDIKQKNNTLYIYVLIIFGLFILSVPIFAEENAHVLQSYYPFGEIKSILNDGKLDMNGNMNLMSYRQWPGLHLITANIVYIGNIKFEDITKYMPLFWMITYIFVSFCIGKSLNFSSEKSFLLVLLCISSFWLPQNYYGGQSIAFLAYIFIFWIILRLLSLKKLEDLIILIALIILIITSHLLTPVILYFIIMCVWIYSKYKKRENKLVSKIVILYSVIFFTWNIYFAKLSFNSGITALISQILRFDPFYFSSSTVFKSTSPIKDSVNEFRYAYLIIYVICFIIILFSYKRWYKDNNSNIVFIWIIGVMPIIFFQYGMEIYERLFMLDIIPLMCMVIIVIKNKKILSLLLLLLIVIHIPAHYGSESFDITRTTDLSGSEFFAQTISPNGKYFYHSWNIVAFYNNNITSNGRVAFDIWSAPNISILENVKYIIDSKTDIYYIKYYANYNPFENIYEEINMNNALIYNNKDYRIFIKNNLLNVRKK